MRAYSTNLPLYKHLAVRETVVVLIITVLLPFLVHLIPYTGMTPLGATLLPIFYAPLVAILLFRWHVGFIAGILAPFIHFLITGLPAWPMVLILSVDLALFLGMVWAFRKTRILKWIGAPIAYLLAKGASSFLVVLLPISLTTSEFWISSVSVALPGLLILLIINILVLRFHESRS